MAQLITTITLLHLFLFSFFGFSQVLHINEDFNTVSLPFGWTNVAISGAPAWSLGINGASAHSGNTNIDGTSFVYFDDDALGATSADNTVELITPRFNNLNNTSTLLEFDYNFRQLASVADSFIVEVFDGFQWFVVLTETTNNCGNYTSSSCAIFPHARIDISAFSNANCQVKFKYHDGNDWGWYIGLDNVKISSPLAKDIGVSKILTAQTNCGFSNAEIITVQINNYGAQAVSIPFNITLDVNNGSQVINEVITTGIAANDSIIYSFTGAVNLAAIISHSILIYTNYSIDSDNSNDSLVAIVRNTGLEQLPYFEIFETQHSWTIGGVNPSWQTGIPNGNFIKNRYSNNRSIVTNLNGTYNSSENSFIESPCFDMSSSAIPILSFDMNHELERNNFDSLIFESSIDGGNTWQTVIGDSSAVNWSTSGSFWTESSNGWKNIENRLPFLANQSVVKFRFRLNSDNGTNLEGVAIDNFTIRYNSIYDLKLVEILSPNTTGFCSDGNENIVVRLKNKGLTPLDSFTVSYQVNAGTIFTDTIKQLIRQGQQLDYVFKSRFNFLNGVNNELNLWLNTLNDVYYDNDSILNFTVDTSNFNSNLTAYTLPYEQNFDAPSWGSPNGGLSIGAGWMRNRMGRWRVDSATVANCFLVSGGIRPAADPYGVSSNFLSSYYVNAILTSPCIELPYSENITLEFYHFQTDTSATNVLIQIYNGISWKTIYTIDENRQTTCNSNWTRHQSSLESFKGQSIKVRIQNVAGSNFAIDNFKIYERQNVDARLVNLESPVNSCSPDENISVLIENCGTSAISNIPISYQINGGSIVTESIRSNIFSLDSLTFIFNQSFNFAVPSSSYQIKTWLALVGDQNALNDTVISTVRNTRLLSNYFEDFELFTDGSCGIDNFGDSIGDWLEASNSLYAWNVGDVAYCGQGTYNINTGPDTDHTLGNGTFMYLETIGGGGDAELITPCLDFSRDSAVELSFWYHKYGSSMEDLFIDIYANGIWNHNIDSIIGQTHFSSNAPWSQKVIALNQFAGQVIEIRFRATYNSNATFNSDMAIDDVHIFNPLTVSINKPTPDSQYQLYPNPNTGNFNLQVTANQIGALYQIFDMKGSIVKAARISATLSQIELNNADKGIYFLKIEGVNKIEKLVIQ